MSEPPTTTTNKRKSTYKHFNRFGNRFNPANRNNAPAQRPISMQISKLPSNMSNGDGNASQQNGEPLSFRIDDKNCEYPGWKLYFPQDGESIFCYMFT